MEPRDKLDFPLRVAGVDVGSNGIRFAAAEFTGPAAYRVLASERAAVRLGAEVFRDHRIRPATLTAAAVAIGRFHRLAQALAVDRFRAVATSAVRDSQNAVDLTRKIAATGPFELEVISGSEEARLVFQAVRGTMPLGRRPWLIANVGGGSVELSLAQAGALVWSESHTLGAVRLLQEFAGVPPTGPEYLQMLQEYLRAMQLRSALPRGLAGLILTGGNIEVLAKLGRLKNAANIPTMALSELRAITSRLSAWPVVDRGRKFKLKPDRADVILPAALAYERIAELAQRKKFWIPGVGTREGLLYDLMEQAARPLACWKDQRQQTQAAAIRLGRRYRFDERHGLQVARLALSLFDQLAALHGLGHAERRLLQAAGMLHDVGIYVSYKKHHKHSLYLIGNSELPGFTPSEMWMVANIARYHRKKGPQPDHAEFHRLARPDQGRVLKLAALLRIADALDREHSQAVRRVRVTPRPGRVLLQTEPRGTALEQWALGRKLQLFQQAYHTRIAWED